MAHVHCASDIFLEIRGERREPIRIVQQLNGNFGPGKLRVEKVNLGEQVEHIERDETMLVGYGHDEENFSEARPSQRFPEVGDKVNREEVFDPESVQQPGGVVDDEIDVGQNVGGLEKLVGLVMNQGCNHTCTFRKRRSLLDYCRDSFCLDYVVFIQQIHFVNVQAALVVSVLEILAGQQIVAIVWDPLQPRIGFRMEEICDFDTKAVCRAIIAGEEIRALGIDHFRKWATCLDHVEKLFLPGLFCGCAHQRSLEHG